MEDDREQDSTIEVDEQELSETEHSDNEDQASANQADPGGDVIIIK
jgi:hypothetical protein